jgi:AraC-like DNA-binding protein
MNLEIAKNIFNFLMIAGIILGLFFVITTRLSKRGKHKSVLYLILVVLFLTLNNLQIVLIDSGLFYFNSFVRKLLIPWYLLILPCFYSFLSYYLQIETKIYSFVRVTIFLFLIEISFRIGLAFFYFYETANYIVARYSQIEEIINALFTVFIFAKAFLLLFRYSNLYQHVLRYDNIRWLKIFMALGALVLLLWFTAIASNLSKVINPEIYIYYPMRLSCSVILYWIGYQGFFNYNILTQRIELRKDIANKIEPNKTKLKGISLDIGSKENQFLIIKNHIEANNRYLDPELSLVVLASEIKMSATKVSNNINSYSNSNFSDYINQLRVEKVKTILLNPKYDDFNIEAIGFECGFNSKSTFYEAFKKFANTTPLEFKKENR